MTSDTTTTAEDGVQFAATDGKRSSQRAGKKIFADAIHAVDVSLATKVERCRDWRKDYISPVRDIVAAGVTSSADALRIARDGLDAVQRNVTFVRNGSEMPLRNALANIENSPFETVTVTGEGDRVHDLEVPYRRELLRGDGLRRQLETWESTGMMEPSCRAALTKVIENPDWLDLSGDQFALLGAASEMGPLAPLSAWGANIIAVDLPRRHLWEHIVSTAREGSGRLHVPTTSASADAGDPIATSGADLLTQTPEVRNWLAGSDGPLTIGNYVYADGSNFVRLAAAVDTLIADMVESRHETSIAYLATPTDVFAVPKTVVDGARAGASRSIVKRAVKGVTRSKLYAPNYEEILTGENGREWGISDSLVPIQGPNYALAKSLQRWRAVTAREHGVLTSANVAPSANTRSVVKNKVLASVYRGAPSFGVEIFDPATARALTAALLVHDLRNLAAASNPQTKLEHPYDLFADNALHGGIWRLPYQPRSILPLGLAIGAVTRKG